MQSTLRHTMPDHAIRLRPPPTEDSSNHAWVMTRKRLSVDRSASYVDRRLVYCPEDELPGFIGSDPTAPGRRDRGYFGTPLLWHVTARFPWLFALMLVQSVSGFVLEGFESLIAEHLILSHFLTMLVGGGGNSSGQTVAELVKRLSRGEVSTRDMPRVLAREIGIGIILALGLGLGAYPRVRLLSRGATNLDALAIALSYTLIIVMANALGVVVALTLHLCGLAAVGAPPVVQVVVDVLGITLTCLVCTAVLS